jgi:hypothetical protein
MLVDASSAYNAVANHPTTQNIANTVNNGEVRHHTHKHNLSIIVGRC